ncbi:MAG: VWA domain-containing protein [Leptospiraceae bacterium]|nr:VWA domain-containing protein [Leptospiraceae bacterium]MDW8307526.1 VWA domain-containing protein [Leptospiraceae bacterium]
MYRGLVFLSLLYFTLWAKPVVRIVQVRTHNFPMVMAELTVGEILPYEHLTKENFRLSEDGRAVENFSLTTQKVAKEPLRMILVLDTSRSIRPAHFKEEIKSAIAFVKAKGEKDLVGIISFDDRPRLVADYSYDGERLAQNLKKVKQGGRHTAIYDALLFAFQKIEEGRKRFGDGRDAIIIFTDGREETSLIKMDDLVQRVERLQVPVFVAGTGHRQKLKALTRLAKLSGGEAYHAASFQDLKKIFQLLQVIFQTNYIISYESKAEFRADKTQSELLVQIVLPDASGKTYTEEDRYFFYIPELKKPIPVIEKSPLIMPWDIRYLFFLTGLSVLLLLVVIYLLLRHRKRTQESSLPPVEVEQSSPREKKAEAVKPSQILPPTLQAYLVEKEGPHAGRRYRIGQSPIKLGSSQESDIVIQDGAVSLRHAMIEYRDGHFILYDLISENGTYLNGKKLLRPKRLHDFDEIQLGLTKFIFRYG